MPETRSDWLQGYDLAAAFWACLAATVASALAAWFWLPASSGGSAWIYLRMAAATLLGADALAPPATFSLSAAAAATAVLLLGCALLTLAITLTLHRWGFLVGVIGGAAIGVASHLILVKTSSLAWPWLVALDTPGAMIATATVAAIAGAVYELLDETDEGVSSHVATS